MLHGGLWLRKRATGATGFRFHDAACQSQQIVASVTRRDASIVAIPLRCSPESTDCCFCGACAAVAADAPFWGGGGAFGAQNSPKISIEKQVPERRAQGHKMEAPGTPKSSKNVKKAVPEAGSGKDATKVRKRGAWDPQKHGFRTGGVTKITKSRGLRKVTKMTPK